MEPIDIVLTEGDARLGSLAEDGSIAKWPDKDIFGHEYTKELASMLYISGGFAVIPPDGGRRLGSVTVSKPPTTRLVNKLKDIQVDGG